MPPLQYSAEEWQMSQAMGSAIPLMGDFYREPDTTMRGVSIAVSDPGMGMHTTFSKGGTTDFYKFGMGEAWNPGIADAELKLAGVGVHGPGFGPYDVVDSKQKGFTMEESGTMLMSRPLQKSNQAAEQFQESDNLSLPPTPKDPFFTFALSTLRVSCERPHALMNAMLMFLREKVASDISKITRKKFAIKADVFVNNMMCTLKARAYREENSIVALEIQRRSGDIMTFSGVYQQIAKYLQAEQNFVIISGSPEAAKAPSMQAPALPPDIAAPEGQDAIADMQPLLDMAAMTYSPTLQAEAAAAIASMAEDDKVRDALCKYPQAIEAIKIFLDTDRVDVGYPTCKSCISLAKSADANSAFIDMSEDDYLLRKLVEKVLNEKSQLVKEHCAKAIQEAVPNCARYLSQQQASVLADKIYKLREDCAVGSYMDQAYHAIRPIAC
jgi:hypothetical protein